MICGVYLYAIPTAIGWSVTEPISEQIGDVLDEEELEERRRIAAVLVNSGRHIEIDPEGLLDLDEESEDR